MPEDESLTRHIETFSNSNGLVSGFKKAYDYIGSGVKSIATAIGDFIGYIKIILLSIMAILALCVLLVILCYFYPVFKCLTDRKPKPQKKNQKKQQNLFIFYEFLSYTRSILNVGDLCVKRIQNHPHLKWTECIRIYTLSIFNFEWLK